jgi:hypothetical protein
MRAVGSCPTRSPADYRNSIKENDTNIHFVDVGRHHLFTPNIEAGAIVAFGPHSGGLNIVTNVGLGIRCLSCRIAGAGGSGRRRSGQSTDWRVAKHGIDRGGRDIRVLARLHDARAVATPRDPTASEIVATEGVPEVQVTWFVRSALEPSLKVPVAMNCSVSPFGRFFAAAVTEIETKGAVTVSA